MLTAGELKSDFSSRRVNSRTQRTQSSLGMPNIGSSLDAGATANPRLERTGAQPARQGRAAVGAGRSTAGSPFASLRENGALSGSCLPSAPLRENQALETDPPSGDRSAPR